MPGECSLLNICINPSRQGQGYGRMLLTHLLENAKSKNAEKFVLEVRASNYKAIALYECAGFIKIAVRKDYYPTENGREDALIYSLELDSDS